MSRTRGQFPQILYVKKALQTFYETRAYSFVLLDYIRNECKQSLLKFFYCC